MRHIQYLFLALFLVACDAGDFFSIPNELEDGNYDYDSTSIYFDDKGDQSERGTNTGSFDLAISGSTATLAVYPRLGWSYNLSIDNLTDHTLGDGSIVTSFSVLRTTQFINDTYSSSDNEFRVDGTRNVELVDGGSTVGTYDGLILSNGEMDFEFESINIETGEYVITTITGYPVD